MANIMDSCFLCSKDYNCVSVDDRIVFQVEYILPEITIFKLGIPLRICSVCDGALYAFSKFKQFYVESSRRLEANIKAQTRSNLSTPTPAITVTRHFESKSSDESENMEEENLNVDQLNESILDIKLHNNSIHIVDSSEKFVVENENLDDIYLKEEQLEQTQQDKDYYNSVIEKSVKEESITSNITSNDKNNESDINTDEENIILDSTDEVWEVTDDSEEELETETENTETKNTNQENINLQMEDYWCEICNELFVSKEFLARHMKIHSITKNFQCKICEKSYLLENDLTIHMKIHNERKNISCSVCKMSFSLRYDLYQHLKLHTEIKRYQCYNCGKSYLRKQNLARHVKCHNGTKGFACSICKQVFSCLEEKDNHMKSHINNIVCPACKKVLTKDIYEEHIKTHFSCTICGKLYLERKNLNWHIKKVHIEKEFHNNINNIVCPACKKVLTKDIYEEHIKTHFSCTICNKLYSERKKLDWHIRNFHVEKEFHCDLCTKSYKHKTHLKRHKKQTHKN